MMATSRWSQADCSLVLQVDGAGDCCCCEGAGEHSDRPGNDPDTLLYPCQSCEGMGGDPERMELGLNPDPSHDIMEDTTCAG